MTEEKLEAPKLRCIASILLLNGKECRFLVKEKSSGQPTSVSFCNHTCMQLAEHR